ncbi:cytochrome P450 [Mycena amicta]|nr:cytochrome P450 [Mycena amicta]
MAPSLLLTLLGALGSYIAFHLVKSIYNELTSPLRHLPGPPSKNLLLGHFSSLEKDASCTHNWRDVYGSTYVLRGLLRRRELFTTDLKALNHILLHTTTYHKGPIAQRLLTHFLGNSLLVVEDDEHKRMRRILNPAFAPSHIREMSLIFEQKSTKLRDMWLTQISPESGDARIDVYLWLRKASLDIIGEAGFHYSFDSLDGKPNELDDAITTLFHSPSAQRAAVIRFIQASFPILSLLPDPADADKKHARATLGKIGHELLADSKAAVKASGGNTSSTARDLLSLLVKANMSPDVPESQQLSDTDVVSQIPTFLLAGHETTSGAASWALHLLSTHPHCQQKLRAEILSLESESLPTIDSLNALAYLEHVIRETFRIQPAVSSTIRTAMADDVVPLGKPYVDAYGRMHDNIRIPKGTSIRIPISAVQCDKEIWGADADEFRPERWENIPDAAKAIPGVYSNLMIFLAGPRNCIGYRFSLVELKYLLFTLIRAFEFAPAVTNIEPTSTPIRRPRVRDEKGSQLPLIVRPY